MPTVLSSGATITTSSATTVWISWVSASTDISASGVWSVWNGSTAGTTTNSNSPHINYQPRQLTAAEREAQERRHAEQQTRLNKQREEEAAAKERALTLLRESIDAEQQAQFDRDKSFIVQGQSGKRYRVRHGWSGNVDELDGAGGVVARYCIHPQISVPVEDNMVIQKLMLEADEKRFLSIANKMVVRQPVPA